MPAEEIEVLLNGDNDSFFNEMDRRFDALAGRFSQKLGQSLKGPSAGAGGGGAAGGGGGGGGGIGDVLKGLTGGAPSGAGGGAGGVANAMMQTLSEGISRGVAMTPHGALGSERVMAQNVGVGTVQSIVHNTVGKVPGLGDYANALADSWAESIREPTRRASQKAQAYYGQLAKYGVKVSDEEMAAVANRMIETEERGFQAERRTQRIFEEAGVDHNRALGYGLSRLGI